MIGAVATAERVVRPVAGPDRDLLLVQVLERIEKKLDGMVATEQTTNLGKKRHRARELLDGLRVTYRTRIVRNRMY